MIQTWLLHVDGKDWSSCGSDFPIRERKQEDPEEDLMIRVVRFY